MDIRIISIIAVGAICITSAAAAAISDAKVVAAALEGMARQPEAQGPLFRPMLVGIGLVEAT
ncbi:MAG: ATP synthase F0 subunit C, partial [Firmicutes bacterium]|nr:ATP synthase F0 subunit C [Bacillota bacterium]